MTNTSSVPKVAFWTPTKLQHSSTPGKLWSSSSTQVFSSAYTHFGARRTNSPMFLMCPGKVKSIGVSNFSIKNLEILLPHCKVIPVTNQVQMHPCLPGNELKQYCEAKGILLTAYSPFGELCSALRYIHMNTTVLLSLGQSNQLFFPDPDFQSVAAAHNATPAQIAISWAVQRGTATVPKSANPERMKTNLKVRLISSRRVYQFAKVVRSLALSVECTS